MMTRGEMLSGEFQQEAATTRRVLDRMPEDRLNYRPHEKSWTMLELATHIANLPNWAHSIVGSDEFDINPPGGEAFKSPTAATKEEVLSQFDKAVAGVVEALGSTPDDDWASSWTFKNGGEVVFVMPKELAARAFVLRHWVHHRGELAVYLRMTGAAIPQIYGPTADEP